MGTKKILNDMTESTLSPELKRIDIAVKKAVRAALADHKRAKNPVAVWQNGKVVIVPPHKIPDFTEDI